MERKRKIGGVLSRDAHVFKAVFSTDGKSKGRAKSADDEKHLLIHT